jgi:hypothetical protein
MGSFLDEALAETPAMSTDPSASPATGPLIPVQPKRRRRTSSEAPNQSLMGWGVTLSLLGLGSFILPLFGLQFKILYLLGGDSPIVGAILALIGAVLLLVALKDNLLTALGAAGGVLGLLGILWLFQGGSAGPTEPSVASAGARTELLGGSGGGKYELTDPSGKPLVGFRFTLKEWGREKTFKQLEPVFETSADAAGAEGVVVAKDGYAVGALLVDADQFVNAVQVVFMRISNGQLQPDDSYQSDWIGTPTGRPAKQLGGSGAKVLGIHGGKGLVVDSVGLILEAD